MFIHKITAPLVVALLLIALFFAFYHGTAQDQQPKDRLLQPDLKKGGLLPKVASEPERVSISSSSDTDFSNQEDPLYRKVAPLLSDQQKEKYRNLDDVRQREMLQMISATEQARMMIEQSKREYFDLLKQSDLLAKKSAEVDQMILELTHNLNSD